MSPVVRFCHVKSCWCK